MPAPLQQAMLMTSTGAGISPPAAAFLVRTSGLNIAHTDAYTTLINGLVIDNIWPQLDSLQIYATQDSTTALLNLVSTSFTHVIHGSPIFTVDRGFTGIAASSTDYIDTIFAPRASTGNYSLNSGHISAWSVADIGTVANSIMGAVQVGPNESDIYPRFTDGKAYFRLNGAGVTGITNASGAGHYLSNRQSSTSVEGYKNGSQIVSTLGLTNSPTVALFTLGINNSTTPIGSAYPCAASSIGGGLSPADIANFYIRLRTYMTAVGVP